ncbi:MAG TPA: cell envelope integrity protein TolA [Methylothermaceae bacterium]|nr:cell envelope integrity protein TolA [Methylothermaceae bacterium]
MNRLPDWLPALLKSLGLHGLLLALILFRLNDAPAPLPPAVPPQEIIEAVAVDESQVQQELQRFKAREEAELKRKERLKRQRLAEERRIRELKRKRLAEKKRLEALAQAKRRKAEEEARRLAQLRKRQQEEAERLARLEQARKEAERKRVEEERRRREAERKRREAERRRQAEKARKKTLEAKRREEAKRLAAEEARRQQAIDRQVAATIARIRRVVERVWLRPPSYHTGLSCTIQVKVAPGGRVVAARVVRSSGDPNFDRSAEVAVRKASPLPIPDDPEVASQFREFKFVFTPQG